MLVPTFYQPKPRMKRILHRSALPAIASRFASTQHTKEDQDDLERERQLREKFSKKVSAFVGTTSTQEATSQRGPTKPTTPFFSTFTGRLIFFLTSIYMLSLLAQMDNPNSAITILQGIPWWQLPPDVVAYFTLCRAMLSFSEQATLRSKFEEFRRVQPTASFANYCQQMLPGSFSGHRTSEHEIIGALVTILQSSTEFKVQELVSRTAGMSRDRKTTVDNVMDALRKEYPHILLQ